MRALSFGELDAVSGAGLLGSLCGVGMDADNGGVAAVGQPRLGRGLTDCLLGGIVDGIVGTAVGGLTGGANGGAAGTGGVLGVGVLGQAVGVTLGMALGGLTGAAYGLSGGYVGTQSYRDDSLHAILTGGLLPRRAGLV